MRVFSCVAHGVVFGLLEKETDAGYSQYELRKDSLPLGICEFPSHLAPRFSVSDDGSFAVYGGCNAYIVSKDQGLTCFEEREEISKIWFLGGEILIECDTLLTIRSRMGAETQKEYWHTEIITSGILNGSESLIFQDLENGVYQLTLDNFLVSPSDYPFAKLS
jgi:hypothetical protein